MCLVPGSDHFITPPDPTLTRRMPLEPRADDKTGCAAQLLQYSVERVDVLAIDVVRYVPVPTVVVMVVFCSCLALLD